MTAGEGKRNVETPLLQKYTAYCRKGGQKNQGNPGAWFIEELCFLNVEEPDSRGDQQRLARAISSGHLHTSSFWQLSAVSARQAPLRIFRLAVLHTEEPAARREQLAGPGWPPLVRGGRPTETRLERARSAPWPGRVQLPHRSSLSA